jgi:hypothetical protein
MQNLDVSLSAPETIPLPAWLIMRLRLLGGLMCDKINNLDFTQKHPIS